MEDIRLRDILLCIIVTPILMLDIWFACAMGRLYEDGVRCDNGATQFCVEK